MPRDLLIDMRIRKSLTTRLVFHVALDEQVVDMYKYALFFYVIYSVVTVDATHRPVDFLHLHAGIAEYFHRGGQRFQNLVYKPTKWIQLSVSL